MGWAFDRLGVSPRRISVGINGKKVLGVTACGGMCARPTHLCVMVPRFCTVVAHYYVVDTPVVYSLPHIVFYSIAVKNVPTSPTTTMARTPSKKKKNDRVTSRKGPRDPRQHTHASGTAILPCNAGRRRGSHGRIDSRRFPPLAASEGVSNKPPTGENCLPRQLTGESNSGTLCVRGGVFARRCGRCACDGRC